MFSKTCEYAIRAVLFIAHKSEGGNKVSIKDIARGIDSPEHFVAKILQNLSKKGLLQSQKGPAGGFYLDDASRKHSLADIVKAIDGDKLFSGCGLGLKQCSETRPCPIHNEYKEIRKKLISMLEKARVGIFSEELAKNMLFLKRK
ncbi:Rrf2 family transcriptional regulator [Niabella ginsenosidivorans]|uniref:Rrf2 family transcriptional regulator n=1 Tax=Niabella ginsenosidivorans TaxID=1176587 RepID=A0A1A9I5P1_9BACT|nr:Rrf2 family transcriptional regulator [Niabella ginsenosidivorans]ANH82010.1 Rrf2 family transcriptional regulator [Niabella ginsenosidivorans]